MEKFVGIDLGTTNSAICSYDGENIRIWKSPEQNDVTPSVISFDKRGNKYVGKRAYDSAPQNPKNAAQLFKRFMGTKTPIHIQAIKKDMSPEECSAEILKTLYGYLPEELRNDPEVGTVITVPAAFNQMQKTATREAAEMAGITNLALMQEPVAAIMSVMRLKKTDGMFLIYDFGGGTLDIAIAESIGKQVNLLAHGGIAMCGGRDFDRGIFSHIIRPWLEENFDLPEDLMTNPQYQTLCRLAIWAAEKAKIELSSAEESHISLTEFEVRTVDLNGDDIYLDIPMTRRDLNEIMSEKIDESVAKVREILEKNNLDPSDVEKIVFVGGPTNYKPLRDKVCFELGIPGDTGVNPMTAVAEGAAVYAESIDWTSKDRHRKNARGQVKLANDAVSFNYIARTSEEKAKLAVQVKGSVPAGMEFRVDSLDTGWTSGMAELRHGKIITLDLPQKGSNAFKIYVFDALGDVVKEETIIIDRTSATISAIPASHSIGVEILTSLGQSTSKLEWLIKVGDQLPKKGQKLFKAAQVIKANSSDVLNFKLWEGEVEEPVSDNRFIGVFSIHGYDLEYGVIPAGADLICDYEMTDSGNIEIEISVPQIGSSFKSDHNFYSRQEAAIDYSSEEGLDKLLSDGEEALGRVEILEESIYSEKLQKAREKLEAALSIASSDNPDAEPRQEAADNIYEAKRLLYEVRKENETEVRQAELNAWCNAYNEETKQYADAAADRTIQQLLRRAQDAVTRRDHSFEEYMDALRGERFRIMWRQNGFVIRLFQVFSQCRSLFTDKQKFDELMDAGVEALNNKRIDELRHVVAQLYQIPRVGEPQGEAGDLVNIIRG